MRVFGQVGAGVGIGAAQYDSGFSGLGVGRVGARRGVKLAMPIMGPGKGKGRGS